jgi:hypothetical protein
MKKLLIASSLFLAMAFTTNSVKAQISGTDVIAAAGNLVNVQVGNIDVNAVDVVDVDLDNVLNNNDIRVLTDFLKGITIDNVLTNVLQNADIITGNQVVVGVVVDLLGNVTQVIVADKSDLKGAKGKK